MSDAPHSHRPPADDLFNTEKGIRALKVSIVGLTLTTFFQAGIALAGGSAGLLADTIHNLGDIGTALPLWIAFSLARREANRRFTYGYGRAEDVAGAVILLFIIASGIISAVESYSHLIGGVTPDLIEWGMLAAIVGVIGNEIVAQYKIRVGKEISSVALVADGQHSRADGLTSLAAFVGLLGVKLGFSLADPIAGLFITLFIIALAWNVGRDIVSRLMDAVDPALIKRMEAIARQHPKVHAINDLRARWVGHNLTMEMAICVDGALPVLEAHAIAESVRLELLLHVPRLSNVIVHVDPIESYPGEHHVKID
jgi:cation diffusion facilitator family transporter